VPVNEDALEQTFRRGTNPVPDPWPAPECFVCGPRDDGLRISPRHLPDTELWTTVRRPDGPVSADGTIVDSYVVWGALDCPAGFAVGRAGLAPLEFFPALTSMAAVVEQPVRVGQPVAILAWLILDGDEHLDGGSAIVDADGIICARAFTRHARLPLDFVCR
jgi:hypothetical protein